MNENPYQAPSAELDLPAPELGELHAPRGVESGRGMAWFREGWQLIMKAPLAFGLMSLVFLLLWGLVSLVPILGGLALVLFWPHAMAGFYRAAARARLDEQVTVGILFEPFSDVGRLLGVGGLYLLGSVLLMLVALLGLGMSGMFAMFSGGEMDPATMEFDATGFTFLLTMLLVLALSIPYMMAFLFAPVLVDRHNLKAMEAVKLSLRACLRNIMPFLIWGLVWFGVWILVGILTLIPLLGALILIAMVLAMVPLSVCSLLVAYEDIFVK